MQIREQRQLNPVTDEVLALTAVVRPILTGTLYALKADVVAEVGGYEQVKMMMLPRLYRAGDGDCGICFEYAVHEAISRGENRVLERIEDAAKLCKLNGQAPPKSILFGLEKTGTQQLIDTSGNVLTDDSRLLYGTRGQPAKLKRHLSQIAGAFRNRKTRLALPYSIRGLWKADLFVGYTDVERWVATTVKINPTQLEGAAGLRIGIVPTKQGPEMPFARMNQKTSSSAHCSTMKSLCRPSTKAGESYRRSSTPMAICRKRFLSRARPIAKWHEYWSSDGNFRSSMSSK